MTDDESGYKKEDYVEIEFELGDLEFEAKGSSAVVERLFNLLIDKIESGAIKVEAYEEDEEEEDSEERDEDTEDEEEDSETEVSKFEDLDIDKPHVEPPPEWESLDNESPAISDAERKAFDIE